jgi:hypothetical protein
MRFPLRNEDSNPSCGREILFGYFVLGDTQSGTFCLFVYLLKVLEDMYFKGMLM